MEDKERRNKINQVIDFVERNFNGLRMSRKGNLEDLTKKYETHINNSLNELKTFDPEKKDGALQRIIENYQKMLDDTGYLNFTLS